MDIQIQTGFSIFAEQKWQHARKMMCATSKGEHQFSLFNRKFQPPSSVGKHVKECCAKIPNLNPQTLEV
jgi:hypothetical protein